jgi:hypothetical protein
VKGSYSEGGLSRYILHPLYAENASNYTRAFEIIQTDFLKIFEYIEPCDRNSSCYSHRINNLLIMICCEVETNFKAILDENGYKKNKTTINDYKSINKTHLLSSYEVKIPYWKGDGSKIRPFECWKDESKLEWYQLYNDLKHNRQKEFEKATLGNLVKAICGLVVVLSSQFYTESFSPGNQALLLESNGTEYETAIGNYFGIKFPNFPNELRYDFSYDDFCKLSDNQENPFLKFNYNEL